MSGERDKEAWDGTGERDGRGGMGGGGIVGEGELNCAEELNVIL